MAGAVFQRSRTFEPVSRTAKAASRPLPRGYGLLIGAGASLSLWAGLALGLVRLLE